MRLHHTPVLALGLLSAGCALLTATPPQVEVQKVELVGAGPLDQVLNVTLCVTNSNDQELAFRRVTVAADVASAPLAESSSDSDVRLPPHAAVPVPFTAVTTVRNLGPQLLSVIQTGGVDYRVHGTIQLMGSLASTLPFSHSGRLDLLASGGNLLADVAASGATKCQAGRQSPT